MFKTSTHSLSDRSPWTAESTNCSGPDSRVVHHQLATYFSCQTCHPATLQLELVYRVFLRPWTCDEWLRIFSPPLNQDRFLIEVHATIIHTAYCSLFSLEHCTAIVDEKRCEEIAEADRQIGDVELIQMRKYKRKLHVV